MATSIWKGSIAFGLVQIRVDLVSAERSHEIGFHLLDRRDMAPVGYDRRNKESGKKVEWSDIVRGYEHAKGEYVVLTDAELESVNVEATQTIELKSFVDASEIDPMYFERPYYLVPSKGSAKDKSGARAYALLRDTLERTGKVGVGTLVIRTRQHLAAVIPRPRALVLMLMRYADEVRGEDELALPDAPSKKVGPTPRELQLAETLVTSMVESWDPTQYRDDYREDVMALIAKKVKAGAFNTLSTAKKPVRAPRAANVIDLMSLLQKSVGERKRPLAKKAGKPRSAARKSA